jgi:hypothetical protein
MKKMTEAEWRKKQQCDDVLDKGEAFLLALLKFCNGDPDKVAEGAGVWFAGVKATAMVVKQKYPDKWGKKKR